jgi:hypothetical protein
MVIFGKAKWLKSLKSLFHPVSAKPLFTGSNPVAASIFKKYLFLITDKTHKQDSSFQLM